MKVKGHFYILHKVTKIVTTFYRTSSVFHVFYASNGPKRLTIEYLLLDS